MDRFYYEAEPADDLWFIYDRLHGEEPIAVTYKQHTAEFMCALCNVYDRSVCND